MNKRREFIRLSGAGMLAATIIPGKTVLGQENGSAAARSKDKKIRIGIIGAENSHTIAYGKTFNIEKRFPGIEVKYVWGETEAFARNAVEKGGIPNRVKDPREMLGKIDALIVDHRHAKYHLPAALPFVEAGVPTFVDKPFCYRVDEGKAFLEKALEKGTPVTSYSSIAQSAATFDIRDRVKGMQDIEQVVRYGVNRAGMHNKYGGIFFYGVHTVQPLMYIFGDDIREVRMTENGGNWTASMAYENGLLATLVFTKEHYGWETYVAVKKGVEKLVSRVPEPDPPRNITDMVEMFRTGKLPRTYQSILDGVSVLEAMERSVESKNWEEVRYVKI